MDADLSGYSVKIRGKGGKERRCPLWPSTIEELKPLIVNRSPAARVFLNRCGHPITRFGIHALVERYGCGVQAQMPSLAVKRVSPHSIRHSTATHLLRAGVDINTSRLAGARFSRYDEHLRGNRSGDESQGPGKVRSDRYKQIETALAR